MYVFYFIKILKTNILVMKLLMIFCLMSYLISPRTQGSEGNILYFRR